MKTAISLPDELFNEVEQLVRRTKRPRSEVYAEALREYMARHAPEDETTRQMNEALEAAGDFDEDLRFLEAAAAEVIRKTEW
jgi:metal-responsive CopG/Arc/MetJ family transcriptional regulator